MVADIFKFLFILLEVVLIFNLMILVHEWGHFLAARWRGLVVEKFAIWFGKPIWKKRINGVEYRLGSIPAGGFVAIPQLAPMEIMEGEVETDRSKLPPIRPIDKIIVAAAGPLFSFLLALFFACVVWILGRPVSEAELSTTVGFVAEEGPAAKAGIQPGDRILAVNGVPVQQFSPAGNSSGSIIWNVARSESPIIPIQFERDGQVRTVDVEPLAPERKGWGRRNLRQIGIAPEMTPRVATVFPDSPASEAGIRPGDLVVTANGIKLRSMAQLGEMLEKLGTQPVTLGLRRDGKDLTVSVTPRIPAEGEQVPRIGLGWDMDGALTRIHPTPIQQVRSGVTTMWETLGAVLSPKSDIKAQHLSGPVGIMNAYYILFQREDGWLLALWFSVVLNINLALLNLLPIPVLDGGHITLALLESIMRRPVNVRILEFVQNGCALAIIGFMLYVTFFDVLDLGGSKGEGPPLRTMRFEKEAGDPASP